MSKKAKAMLTLLKMGKITRDAILKAVSDKIITEEEAEIILNS